MGTLAKTSILKKNLLTPALIILTAISFGYSYKKNKENSELKTELRKNILEKNDIQEKIAEITNNYEKVSTKNKKLSKRFISEINKIIKLKESVHELDDDLKTDKTLISKKTILANNLADKNEALSKEIKEAKSLKINAINVSKMRKKSSGKYTSTTKNTKIDAFKINTLIQKNELTPTGQKIFHLQLINPFGEIISVDKQVRLNNKAITCSNEIIFEYKKEKLNLVSVIEVDRENLKPGKYLINALIDGKHISNTSFNID